MSQIENVPAAFKLEMFRKSAAYPNPDSPGYHICCLTLTAFLIVDAFHLDSYMTIMTGPLVLIAMSTSLLILMTRSVLVLISILIFYNEVHVKADLP